MQVLKLWRLWDSVCLRYYPKPSEPVKQLLAFYCELVEKFRNANYSPELEREQSSHLGQVHQLQHWAELHCLDSVVVEEGVANCRRSLTQN